MLLLAHLESQGRRLACRLRLEVQLTAKRLAVRRAACPQGRHRPGRAGLRVRSPFNQCIRTDIKNTAAHERMALSVSVKPCLQLWPGQSTACHRNLTDPGEIGSRGAALDGASCSATPVKPKH